MEKEKTKKFIAEVVVWAPTIKERTVQATDYDDAVEQVSKEFGDNFIETVDCYEVY